MPSSCPTVFSCQFIPPLPSLDHLCYAFLTRPTLPCPRAHSPALEPEEPRCPSSRPPSFATLLTQRHRHHANHSNAKARGPTSSGHDDSERHLHLMPQKPPLHSPKKLRTVIGKAAAYLQRRGFDPPALRNPSGPTGESRGHDSLKTVTRL